MKGAEHEHDRHTPILTALKDCGVVVISLGMGMRIYNDLKAIGIEVVVSDETDVKKALELYLDGKLIDTSKIVSISIIDTNNDGINLT